MSRKPTQVIVDKRNYKGRRGGKWRVGVVYKPKHGRVHLMSNKHKDKAVSAATAIAMQHKIPLIVYTQSGIYSNAETRDFS